MTRLTERKMKSHKVKLENKKSIPEMVKKVSRATMSKVCYDGKLTAKVWQFMWLLDRALPGETVDEWGTAA